jgi:hypothetical protein
MIESGRKSTVLCSGGSLIGEETSETETNWHPVFFMQYEGFSSSFSFWTVSNYTKKQALLVTKIQTIHIALLSLEKNTNFPSKACECKGKGTYW